MALPVLPGEKYNLNCVQILEKLLPSAGYNLKIAEIDQLEDCAAFTVPTESLLVFREDIYDMLHAQHVFGRSTVVHEMAHIVLNHAATFHRGAVLGQHKFYEDSEWQAKALTAAIMMPVSACKEAETPERLAELCGTSVASASYRLDKLKQQGEMKGQRRLFY
ncbi:MULTISPECIES: ImmA/IrrE family metallo-endopeptidase [Halopseudomonas]|uniref:ImmA/IrrE family metallo-endopeptidase n=1 Tax=Halopseudomonas TaxID=2901189 RepID=UPI0022B73C38|nr:MULTISPECIES: ImmA/IrrE family metallo-endopeptidase [Halopseudomonas]